MDQPRAPLPIAPIQSLDQPQQKSKKAKADGRKNIESFQEVSIIFHKKKNSYKVRFG